MPLPSKLPSNLTYNDLNGQEAIDILTDWFQRLLRSHPQFQPHLTLPMAKFTLDISVGVDMYIGGTVPVESPPEHLDVVGSVTLDNNLSGRPTSGPITANEIGAERREREHIENPLQAIINAAPVPGGKPPDQVRSEHGLSIPRPSFGSRDTGSHLFLADVPPDGGREGIVAEGYTFAAEPGPVQDLRQHIPIDKGALDVDLKGEGITHAGVHVSGGTHNMSVKEQGDQKGAAYGSVTGVYDPGPAGLARPGRSGGLYGDGRPKIEKFK